MSRRSRTFLKLGAAVLVAGSCTAVFYYMTRKVEAAGDLPVATATKGEFLVSVQCRGELVARRAAYATAPSNVPELRIVWMAPPGSPVNEGDPLVRFDPSSLRSQLAEKQAALQQAQASLEKAQADANLTAEQDKRDLANAVYAVERAKIEVSKQELVSAMKGEVSQIDYEVAEKKQSVQEATNAQHATAGQSKIASLQRALDQAKAEVELTQQRLSSLEVKAPISGVVVYATNYQLTSSSYRPYSVGDQVYANAVLADIPDLNTLEMEARIEETDRGKIKIGADARVHIDALPELNIDASLARISPLTQISLREWPVTSSFVGYASLRGTDQRLRPGMGGKVDIVSRRIPDAIRIPSKALFTRRGRPIVYVAREGRYDVVEVKLIARNPDEVAIEGIQAGDQVALSEPGAGEDQK